METLRALDHAAAIFWQWPLHIQVLAIFLIFALIVAPKLAFDTYISRPTPFLQGIAFDLQLNTENSVHSSYQHVYTMSHQVLHTMIHEGHPLLIFIITAFLFSVLWCMNRKKLLSQITTLEDQVTQAEFAYEKARQTSKASIEEETMSRYETEAKLSELLLEIARLEDYVKQTELNHRKAGQTFEATIEEEKESRHQTETKLATVLESIRGAKCLAGGSIDIDLGTKIMVAHSCCQHKEALEQELGSLRTRDNANKAEIERQKDMIRSMKQTYDRPTSRQDGDDSKNYASPYEAQKLQREAYENDISQLTKDNQALERHFDTIQDQWFKAESKIKQLEEELRAVKKNDISQLMKDNHALERSKVIWHDEWEKERHEVMRLEKQLQAAKKTVAATSAASASHELKLKNRIDELEGKAWSTELFVDLASNMHSDQNGEWIVW